MDFEEDADQIYFHAIEEVFVRLRGSPLLLSPADWRVAQRWRREGVPLELVGRTLEEVFARRKERGAKGKISSLRYAAPAVEAAWAELREVAAPGERAAAPALDVAARLASLAAALPEELGGRDGLTGRIRGLSGETEAVERSLSLLDRELLAAVQERLDPAARQEIDAAVDETLASLAGRLDPDEVERSRDRLARQLLRRRLKLPVLSLFSPEAQAGEGAREEG